MAPGATGVVELAGPVGAPGPVRWLAARPGARGGREGLRQAAHLDVDDDDRLRRGGGRGDGLAEGGREDLAVAELRGAVLTDPRDRVHHDRVGGLVRERRGERVPEVRRFGRRRQVERPQRAQSFGQAGVVREEAERLGVAEDRDPGPGGQRLGGEQQARVDEFGDGVDADDPGLAEQRGHGGVGDAGDGHAVAGRGAAAVPGALDDDDRLDGGGAAGEPGELPGVADRLQVEEDDVGPGVVVPVLEEVVAGDVGAIAGRDERGEPGAAAVQSCEQGDPDGAGLGEEPDPPGGRHLGGEGGVEADLGGGVDDPEGVGADDPHPVRAGLPHELALPLPAGGPALGVTGGEDDQPLDAVLAAVRDDLRHPFGGDGDDRQVDGFPDGGDGGVRGDAVELDGFGRPAGLTERRVDRVHASGEPGPQQVAEHGPADPARCAPGSDDGDGPGGEEALDGARLGPLLPRALDGEGPVGGFEVEVEPYGPVLEAALLGVARVGEDLDHLGVGGEHLGGEAPDVPLARDRRDVFEQRGRDAPPLVGVLDEEGDLGLVGGGGGGQPPVVDPVVAHGRDELAADGRRESDPVHEVVVREAVDVLGGEPGVGGEEAVVLRLVRDLLVEADEPVGVVGGDRPDARRATVAEHHIRFPVVGVVVLRLVRRALHGVSLRPRHGRGTGRAAGVRRAR